MKIGLASDHAGFLMKEYLKEWLISNGYEVEDFGCYSIDRCDYPNFAHPLAESISTGKNQVGFSICGSGNGINMVVNKYANVRSAICWNEDITLLARQHNDANICALPARFISMNDCILFAKHFLNTEFDGGRHTFRVDKINKK